jgi:hypothetical protein
MSIMHMHETVLQLRPRLIHKLFNHCESVIIIQALRIEQSATGLDNLARYDLLHRQLDFLEIDRCLDQSAGHGPQDVDYAYGYFWRLKDILGDVSWTELYPDRVLDIVDQTVSEFFSRLH